MDNSKKAMLATFAQKAAQRLEDNKVTKKKKLYVPSLDEEITIRSLTRKEVIEVMAIEDTDDEPDRSDYHTLYIAIVEPSLKELAVELKAHGQIVEYTEVCNIFEIHERVTIAQEIMKLSGVIGAKKVSVVAALKN